jgi:hypothetical protein
VNEDDRVRHQAEEGEEDRLRRVVDVYREEAKSRVRSPGRWEESAAGSVGVGDSLDKAHDGRILVGCGGVGEVGGGEEEVEVGNGVLGGHRGAKVDDVAVAVVVVFVRVVDDDDATAVAGLAAELVAGPVAVAAVAAAAAVVVVVVVCAL